MSTTNSAKRKIRKHRDWVSIRRLVLVAILVVGAVFAFVPPQERVTMGLDIQGGVSAILSASTVDGGTPSQEAMDEASTVIQQRVNTTGASAATVQQQGSDKFLVQVPGAQNASQILDTLSSQGVLEFVDLRDIEDENVRNMIDSGQLYTYKIETDENGEMKTDDAGNVVVSDFEPLTLESGQYKAFMTGDSVTNTTISQMQNGTGYAVDLQLDGEGTKAFADVSTELVSTNGKIAIVLDGVVQSAPAVQSAITGGQVQITGNYDMEEARSLKSIIDSGSLPVTINVEQSSVVGPTLGNDALMVGIIAALIGLAIVLIWLLLFYRGMGLLAGASVAIMAIIYLGLLAAFSIAGWFSLTLPGIAGIIVNIGMAADSAILIMECFHEQVRKGRSFAAAAKDGVHEGIFTSLDADIVTLVSALILYFVAIGDVRGFGFTLAIGIICDLGVMALFSGPIMRLLGPKVMKKHPVFWGMDDDMHEGEYVKTLEAGTKGVA